MKVTLKRIFSRLANIYEVTLRITGVSAGVAAWCGALLVFAGVIARYVFDYGIIFAVEYTAYLTGFIAFVGAVYTQGVKGHVSVNLVVSRLPKRAQQWLGVITLTASLALSLVFLYWASVMVWVSIDTGTRAVGATGTSTVVPQSPLVIGFFLLTIVLIVQLTVAIRGLYRVQVQN